MYSYLWPGYDDNSTNYYVILIALITTTKNRENLQVWGRYCLLIYLKKSALANKSRCIRQRRREILVFVSPRLVFELGQLLDNNYTNPYTVFPNLRFPIFRQWTYPEGVRSACLHLYMAESCLRSHKRAKIRKSPTIEKGLACRC